MLWSWKGGTFMAKPILDDELWEFIAPFLPPPAPRGRPDRLFTRGGGQRLGAGGFGGAQVGPNPTDRRKNGSKHHIITDANGIPLATILTGANRNHVTQLLPLVDAIPPIAGRVG